MTKLVAHYKRIYTLKESLKDLAAEPVDGFDVEGMEMRLHAAHVVVALEKRIAIAIESMSSAEQADVIRG